jgi:predicted XRE-type DNA-binding protein
MRDERFDSMWGAIEDTPAQAEAMRPRSALMTALKEHIHLVTIDPAARAGRGVR